MKQYIELGKDILNNGQKRSDRTGTGTISIFGRQLRFDLSEGFPLVTTKKVHLKSIIHELLWFLRGSTNNNELVAEGVNIWNDWALEDGSVGPIYGSMWRNWEEITIVDHSQRQKITQDGYSIIGRVETEARDKDLIIIKNHDQISALIEGLKNKPFSRRHIVSAWNVAKLPDETISPQENVENDKMCLAPCHALFQFYVDDLPIIQRIDWIRKNKPDTAKAIDDILIEEIKEGKFTYTDDDALVDRTHELFGKVEGVPHRLSCQLFQRSLDTACGGPFNIASYALLMMMVAQCVNMIPGEFIYTLGDAHLYNDHIEKFKEQMTREPYPLPKMLINPEKKDIFSFEFDDFKLEDYQSQPAIKYEISV